MPEPIKQDAGNAGGDDAAAKAAAEKATADAAAAAAAAGNGGGDGEETVTLKKSDHAKLIEERDNYKKGLLAKKADERPLKPDAGGGDAAAQAAAAAAGADDKKIVDTATTAATKALRDANERTAKRSFLKEHPEYVDDGAWGALMSHLTFKGGELTSEEISDRMEAAVLEHKRSTGKLDEYMQAQRERGVREGQVMAQAGTGHGTGGGGDRHDAAAAGKLTPKGEEMARAMHTDPLKAAKVDPQKDNVIDVVTKRKA